MTYRHIALSALTAAAITLTGCGGGSSSTPTTTGTDTTAPVVTLNGTSTVNLTVGDTYTDAGATATDDVDGALTPTSTGTVDPDTADTYTVTYSATDAAGNTGSATRTVVVAAAATAECTDANTISGLIDSSLTLTDTTCLDGKVQVADGVTITAKDITIAGVSGQKSWLEVLPGGKLDAENVIFTSEEALKGETEKAGQWGGVTLIGNDGDGDQVQGYEVDGTEPGVGATTDSSGKIINCTFNNTGIAVEQDKEINGLSLVGIGSGTEINGVTVNRSGDDAVEIWGGHVNLKNVTINETGDDGFDTDDGWQGTVTNLSIAGTTNSGIETSGNTHPTYVNVTINTTGAVATEDVGGAIYLKKTAIGGHFEGLTIVDDANTGYGTIVTDAADQANLSFSDVKISGTNTAGLVTEGPHYDENTTTTADIEALLQ